VTAERPPPAWTRDSFAVRLPGAISLDDLSAEWAWGGSTGAGARVAVIDSGIDATHPALDGCVDADGSIAISIVEGQVVEVVGPHDDSFGHGTACAGIIHTLAPDARITSVKVLGAGLAGRAAAFLRGLGWAIEQRFDVVNLSLGTTRRDWALPFYELCDEAYFANVFVVTAANNMPRASFPSLFGSVTSVACNMTDDPWRFHYNPEPPTEFLARGIDVDVAWRGGGTVTATGNSYAAPHISGLAALIRAKHPELRPFQLKTVLWATAANVRDAFEPAGRLSRTMRRPTAALATGAALTPPRRSARG
jgi:subtilisin family serine protease